MVGRNDGERKKILRFEKVDVIIAMTLAGVVNMSMMIMAAGLFHKGGIPAVEDIDGAFDALKTLVSNKAAIIFGVGLLASGFASSSVGTMAARSSCRASSAAAYRSFCAER